MNLYLFGAGVIAGVVAGLVTYVYMRLTVLTRRVADLEAEAATLNLQADILRRQIRTITEAVHPTNGAAL